MIFLTVEPVGYSTRGQLFDGYAGERLIVSRTATPLLDASRVLVGEGVNPATPITMRYAADKAPCLMATVGRVAGLTVADDTTGKPIFRPWQPYPMAENRTPGTPSMRPIEVGAIQLRGAGGLRCEAA